jgi:DNA-binding NtrC family response regulator
VIVDSATSAPQPDTADVIAIDDDESIRWLLSELFTMSGIRHAVACSGAEGIQLVNQHRPRLVIADVRLGGMNGLEVAHRVSRISPATKVILVTGYGETIRSALHDAPGIMLVLEKPFDIRELLKQVQGVLAAPA